MHGFILQINGLRARFSVCLPALVRPVHPDAASVKTRDHKLEDKDLRVVDVVRNQLLLKDLPHCLSEDLKHFVEVKTDMALKAVKFGEDGHVAVVTFERDIGKNLIKTISY